MFLVIENLFLGRLNLKCNFCIDFEWSFGFYFTKQSLSIKQIYAKLHFTTVLYLHHIKKQKAQRKMKMKILSAWPEKTWMAQRNFPFQFLILLLLKYWEKKKKSEHLNQLKLQFKRYVWKPEDIGQHPPTQTRLYISGPFRDEQLNFWQEEHHLPTSDSNFSEPS